MRKGTSHVDWAISMGIFLVYILLTFIFLKPATEPTYSGNSLLDIAYKGLKDDTSYTIKKGYLKITPTDDIDETKEYTLRIRCLDKSPSYGPDCLSASGMDMDWVESEKDQNIIEKGRHLTLVNESLGKVCCEDMLAVQFDFKDESMSSRNWHVLEMKTKLKKGKENVFWFLYSEEFNYTSHLTVDTTVLTDNLCVKKNPDGSKVNPYCLLADGEISPSCTPGLGSPACFQDKTNFTYQFGVIESQTAFSKDRLDALNRTYYYEYEGLKKEWKFPTDKNFNITIEKLS